MMIIVAAAVSVLMLGGGFAISYMILPGKIAEEIKKSLPRPTDDEEDGHGEAKDAGKDAAKGAGGGHGAKAEGGGKDAAKADSGGHGGAAKTEGGGDGKETAFELKDLLLNTAGSRASRFVKASLSFQTSPEVKEELESMKPKVIDTVSQIISSKTVEELSGPTARGSLRQELIIAVNSILSKGKVDNIYFIELVIQ